MELFLVGGYVTELGFVLGGVEGNHPEVSISPSYLFKKYRSAFHVYEIATQDCRVLLLRMSSEALEQDDSEPFQLHAPEIAMLTSAQAALVRRQCEANSCKRVPDN